MPEDLLALVLAQQKQIAEMQSQFTAVQRQNADMQRQNAELVAAVQRQAQALESLGVRPEVGESVTVQELRDAYEEVVKTRATPLQLRNHLRAWVEKFGQRKVLSLRATEIVAFRDGARVNETIRETTRAPGTRNAETQAFVAMINWGVRDGRIARNPLGPIKRLPVSELETVINRDDEPAIMRAASIPMRAIFLLGVDAGLRLNEIRLLEWNWVDIAGKVVGLPAWVTKTRKARRPRITDRIVDHLKQLPRLLRSPYVFPNPVTGKPFSRVSMWKWWDSLRDEVGLKPAPGETSVRFHSTRHTAGTRINKIAGLKVAMKQLGQESAAVALKYVHASDTDLDAARDQLDEIERDSMKLGRCAKHTSEEKSTTVGEIS